ncbi:hypothetical protein [Heyndrickxia sporothermodurans]|uniref:hypothetical protein n=1 Tax=Heyndrickxia sporothermodurans TaxID=46224 RepID=UPI000D398CC5|nr:hypothetical protein [Heyndrickxia sporothermodurans]PTY93049.1 hypothetical protein B5V90_02900 [Heyndrickxia sporothermodurans]
MPQVQFTYDPLAITRFVMTRYVEEKIQGQYYKAKQFACYEFLDSMTDEELESILRQFIKQENLEEITFKDWENDARIIWDIISELERYKDLETKFKKAGYGLTGLGVLDKSDNTFYDCAFVGHWVRVMEIVENKYPDIFPALQEMYFYADVNESHGYTRDQVDDFILNQFQLIGESKSLKDYIGA